MAKPQVVRLPRFPTGESELGPLKDFASEVVTANVANLGRVSRYLGTSSAVLLAMYCALFAVGILGAIAAIAKGLGADSGGEAAGALAIGGLSAASFLSFFLARPVESVERNTIYSQWLIATVNSYWTRLAYLSDPATVDRDLEEATRDLVRDLKGLADHHAAALGKYPGLAGAGRAGGPATPAPAPDAGAGRPDH